MGFLCADLISGTLGTAHITKFSDAMANFNEEWPVGALILATQAVQHVLEQWTATGEYIKGTKQFSLENDGNKEDVVVEVDPNTKRKTHKKVVEYRTTLFSDTIEAKFNEKTWESIFVEARKLAKTTAAKTAGKNQKNNRGKEIEITEELRTKFVVASDSE